MTKYIIYSKNLSNLFEEEILKEKYDELNNSTFAHKKSLISYV